MIRAMPNRNPTRAGSGRKLVTNPSRASPAAIRMIPAMMARVADRATARPGSGETAATVEADRMAAAEVAPTTRWREDPKMA
jgi:hypothetical protein